MSNPQIWPWFKDEVGPLDLAQMTEAQWEMTNLGIALNQFGIKVRFESDKADKHGVRFLKKLNSALLLMDDYSRDLMDLQEERPALLSLTCS